MRKLFVALCAVALVFSPIGDVVFQDVGTSEVEAKRYKSGKKSFNPGNGGTHSNNNNNSLFQRDKKDSSNQNKSTTNQPNNNKGTPNAGGGLMKGLALGGLAGLLFGGLLGNMGIFGAMLGLFINVITIVLLIAIAVKIYQFFKRKRQEDANVWRN